MLLALLVACVGGGGGGDGTAPEELTDLEWSLVGVWRGGLPGDRTRYVVLNDDRTGCLWEREGEDFGVRYDEFQFTDWQLHEDQLDDEDRMHVTLRNSEGELHDIDRYAHLVDELHVAGGSENPTFWIDILILCEDTGTDAVATDVERQGVLGDDGGTGGPGQPAPP